MWSLLSLFLTPSRDEKQRQNLRRTIARYKGCNVLNKEAKQLKTKTKLKIPIRTSCPASEICRKNAIMEDNDASGFAPFFHFPFMNKCGLSLSLLRLLLSPLCFRVRSERKRRCGNLTFKTERMVESGK